MKKILFLLIATVCAFAACEPIHEDFSNGGHITVDELKAKSTVTVDKSASGQNGNVITCSTSAPVNAKWNIGGKDFVGNYAWKKMKLGDYTVVLTALCADGTELTAEYPVKCEVITNALEKFYIYGNPANPEEQPFTAGAGDAAALRFSSTEGQHWPTIPDDVYFGQKTLIFEIKATTPGDHIWGGPSGDPIMRVMNGWWSTVYYDDVELKAGELLEIPITEDLAKECAKGGEGRDMNLLIYRGTVTFGAVYYEE
ncbi:MAG: hypothetical protein IKH59_10330 [Bacteroidaceae bacterium]|nr:hypothetical protein [Bacteroidaceae bacterium]